MSGQASTPPLGGLSDTVLSRIFSHFFEHGSSTGVRILVVVLVSVLVHFIIGGVRRVSEWLVVEGNERKGALGAVTQKPKFVTVTRLAVSTVTFVVYFVALGLILEEFGVNLTAYLASASVLGLAISFGSQGMVQDVVIGLTLIFWDAMDVNDLVEIAGTVTVIGRVEEIGLRFTKLVNFYNQEVFIPNRTIANVSRFPLGGVDAYADPQVPNGADPRKAAQIVEDIAIGMWAQFGAIILSEPVVGTVETAPGGGWSFVRVHFKIWPGQGGLIETTFRQQAVTGLKALDPGYADWQVPVTYRAGTASRTLKPAGAAAGGPPDPDLSP
jgi:moderate conductance mechanosensitive channel